MNVNSAAGETEFLHPYLNQRKRLDFGDGGDVSTYRVVSSPAFNGGYNDRYPWHTLHGFLQRLFSLFVVVVKLAITLGIFGYGAGWFHSLFCQFAAIICALGYWVARKTGFWLVAMAFPTIVGPFLAWKATYGRTKRVGGGRIFERGKKRRMQAYHAARYAQEQGHLNWLWVVAQRAISKIATNAMYIASLGNIDLSPYFGLV